MVDPNNNKESREFNLVDNEDNNNYWINGLLAWWSGFSLRTKL